MRVFEVTPPIRQERAGLGKPETFDFLGFTYICGRSGRGRFLLFRRTRRGRKRAKVREALAFAVARR